MSAALHDERGQMARDIALPTVIGGPGGAQRKQKRLASLWTWMLNGEGRRRDKSLLSPVHSVAFLPSWLVMHLPIAALLSLIPTLVASYSKTFVVPHVDGQDDTPALKAVLANYSSDAQILFQRGVSYNIWTVSNVRSTVLVSFSSLFRCLAYQLRHAQQCGDFCSRQLVVSHGHRDDPKYRCRYIRKLARESRGGDLCLTKHSSHRFTPASGSIFRERTLL